METVPHVQTDHISDLDLVANISQAILKTSDFGDALVTSVSKPSACVDCHTADGRNPQLIARSGHCRTATASSRLQWALPDFNRELQSAVGIAGLHPRAPDYSGHCRTSSASSRSQWALPDFIRELQIPVAPDYSGHCRTSSASSRSQWALPDFIRELQIPVGAAGLQPRVPDASGHCRTSSASSRSQWALPDFIRELQIPVGTAGRAPDPSGHCRTSTASSRSQVCNVGMIGPPRHIQEKRMRGSVVLYEECA
eukprot:s1876_g4.t1